MNGGLGELPRVVYHGTTTEYEESIDKGINLSLGRDKVDFGKGFYTTSSYEQAKNWAKYKSNLINTEIDLQNKKIIKPVKPVIIKYRIDLQKLSELRGKIFREPDMDWSRFVLKNRLGINIEKDLDYVYGPVADGNMAEELRHFRKGIIDEKEFHKRISPFDVKNMDQFTFHTDDALKCLERSD